MFIFFRHFVCLLKNGAKESLTISITHPVPRGGCKLCGTHLPGALTNSFKLPGQPIVGTRPGLESNQHLLVLSPNCYHSICPYVLVSGVVGFYQHFPPQWARCPATLIWPLLSLLDVAASSLTPARLDGKILVFRMVYAVHPTGYSKNYIVDRHYYNSCK